MCFGQFNPRIRYEKDKKNAKAHCNSKTCNNKIFNRLFILMSYTHSRMSLTLGIKFYVDGFTPTQYFNVLLSNLFFTFSFVCL